MNHSYQPCDADLIEFLYAICKNAHIMGLSWFGMKNGKISCMDDGRFLFVLDDLPSVVPFKTGAVTRVSDLYKRIKYFKEVSDPDTIEVYYSLNNDDQEAVQRLKLKSKQTEVEFRFAHISALGKMPGKILDGISDDNIIMFSIQEKKNLLKGLNAVSSEDITIKCEDNKLTLIAKDGLGDKFSYKFEGRQRCFDFERTFNREAFCKMVHQQEDEVVFWIGETKFIKAIVNGLSTFMLMKGE